MSNKLSTRIKEPGLISAPGVFDMISARIADGMGFDALYMTGYGTVASHLGLPDAGLASYTEMVGRVRQIAQGTGTPLIADGDTGYGGLLNVDFTVRGYEMAGAAAIQIEDQEYPKKCGHTPGRRVVPIADATRRVKVASEARSSKDFLIIARTDARTALGLDEALRRGEAFLKAGADILFIESPESEVEMEKIGRTFNVPLVANMVEGGRTPILSREDLEKLGFKLAIFPASGFLAMGAALRSVYGEILSEGSSKSWSGELYPFNDFSKLMGFERVWAFERDHAET
jgi:2-methylisocitrate lyase-like PEP mutase family enzyme